jgi:hypothetical protein
MLARRAAEDHVNSSTFHLLEYDVETDVVPGAVSCARFTFPVQPGREGETQLDPRGLTVGCSGHCVAGQTERNQTDDRSDAAHGAGELADWHGRFTNEGCVMLSCRSAASPDPPWSPLAVGSQ